MTKGRYGYRMGMPDAKIYDHMVYDGLWDVFNNYHMGVTAENVAEAYGITREESDAYAVRSHQRAAKAHEGAVRRPDRTRRGEAEEGDHPVHRRRAHPPERERRGPAEAQAGLQEGRRHGDRGQRQRHQRRRGHDASLQREEGRELGLPVAGRLVSAAVAGVDPSVMGTGMIPASRTALKKAA